MSVADKAAYLFIRDSCYRRVKRMVSLDQALSEESTTWLESLEGGEARPKIEILKTELRERLKGASDSLTEEFRAPVVLVDIGGFSSAEVAQILSCPVGTVRSRLFRGRSILEGKPRAYVQNQI